jgi:hypothetical protein
VLQQLFEANADVNAVNQVEQLIRSFSRGNAQCMHDEFLLLAASTRQSEETDVSQHTFAHQFLFSHSQTEAGVHTHRNWYFYVCTSMCVHSVPLVSILTLATRSRRAHSQILAPLVMHDG